MIIISFLSAILAGMGVGSAGFPVAYLTLILSRPQLEAQLINLIFFISSAVAAMAVNWHKGRLNPKVILICAATGCIGAVCGASFAHSVDENALGKAFGVLLIALGAITLVSTARRGKGGNSEE